MDSVYLKWTKIHTLAHIWSWYPFIVVVYTMKTWTTRRNEKFSLFFIFIIIYSVCVPKDSQVNIRNGFYFIFFLCCSYVTNYNMWVLWVGNVWECEGRVGKKKRKGWISNCYKILHFMYVDVILDPIMWCVFPHIH